MENPFFIGLLENTAILISVAVLYDFIWLKNDKSRRLPLQALLGLLVGSIGIILMKSPWVLVEGIVFDTRSVLLTISGLFMGGITTIIAMLIMVLYRLNMGGVGVYMGIAVIVSSALIGLLWRKLRPKIIKDKKITETFIVSFIVHLVMLACTILLPKENSIATLKVIWWPVLSIYPLATTLIAKLLLNREANWRNKEKLAKSEEKYRLLFENNPNPMWIYDIETLKFLEVNNASVHHYGYSREEFLNMTLKDIMQEEDIPKLLENIKANNGIFQTSGNWRHRKKNGEIIYVQIISHDTEFNGRTARHVTVNDVTQLVNSNRIISQKEQEFSEIFNTSFDSIQIVDIETGKIIDCNDITLQMYGYCKDEILSGKIADLSANIPPYDNDNVKLYLKKTIEGEPQDFEWLARRKNGETFWVNVRFKLVEIGEKKRVMAIVRDISVKKKSEQNLIESEQRFLKVMHFSKDAIGILDDNHQFVECNDSAARLHGFVSRNELLRSNTHPFDLSPINQPNGELSIELVKKMINKALEEGSNKFEWLHNRKYGENFWAEVSLTPIIFNGKRMVYAVWRDISEQKIKQERIEKLSKILDESINEIYVFRCDTLKFIEFNKTAIANIGYSAEELQGLTPLDLKPDLTIEKLNELLSPLKSSTSKVYFESIHRRKDGSEYPVEVYIQKMKETYLEVIIDISQRKKYINELNQREQELREIFNSTQESIIIYDPATQTIVDCNNQTLLMYGYNDKSELIGQPIGFLSANEQGHSPDKVLKWKEKAEQEGPQIFQWLGKKRNGKTFWVEISLKKTMIGGKERLMAVVRDITERKQYEEDLIKAKEKAEESDRLKSAFLANLSHEIRTPMNAIIGFTDLLKHVNTDAKRIEYVDIIEKSGMRLLDIINETIEIAKLDTGLIKVNPETFNLDQLMQDIYNELKIKVAGKRELELIYLPNHSNYHVTLYTDRVKLQQILTNLITNGIKYTPRGAVAFGYEVKGDRVIFSVKDTGIGIDRKNREMIFKRFYRIENPLTMKVGGIGLGLSIAKAYTELLGGTIMLESELGRGTSVTVSLPYIKGEPQTELFVELPAEKLKGDNKLILVAEDDEYNYMYINEILKQYKYNCLRAANGQEAIELAQKNGNIRLILMDLKMPIMDGYQTFEQIKKLRPTLPVIAQTAYALGEDIDKIKSYGFDGYISKPIRKDELLNIVSEKLRATE